jgi:hypothetical protein
MRVKLKVKGEENRTYNGRRGEKLVYPIILSRIFRFLTTSSSEIHMRGGHFKVIIDFREFLELVTVKVHN